ncbi:MAG: winged helix-turn-helix transcriptional regulator [Nitrososphaerota archaeon]|nr:winged helix-turn-helix transcriptional regulator [Nitrososphaerota archaeon]
MDSLATYALLSASFFFVALSSALLLRYRQVSQRINASSDLGHDLWSSLEQRLKKQDERILDLMGRVEVIQARAMASSITQTSSRVSLPSSGSSSVVSSPVKSSVVTDSSPPMQRPAQEASQSESHQSQESQLSSLSLGPSGVVVLDATQVAALRALSESPRNTRQLTDFIQKSREHTARLMKQLFEAGLVERDNTSKPFVYQLTDEGRRRLSGVG